MLYEGKTHHCTRRLSEGMGKNINEPQHMISNNMAF